MVPCTLLAQEFVSTTEQEAEPPEDVEDSCVVDVIGAVEVVEL